MKPKIVKQPRFQRTRRSAAPQSAAAPTHVYSLQSYDSMVDFRSAACWVLDHDEMNALEKEIALALATGTALARKSHPAAA